MSVRFVSLIVIFISVAFAFSFSDAKEMKYVDFLRQLVDLDSLPLVEEGVQCKQWSSYDRGSKYDAEKDEYINWGANADVGQYIRVDEKTGEGVMAEIEGPGCIYRIWSANPQGKIRFYLDGSETPSYEFDHKEMYIGKTEPFVRPIVWQRNIVFGDGNPASDSYLPIPFAKSCKVTADKAHGQFFHIGYKTFPKHWQVQTFHLPLTDEEKNVLKEVCDKLEKCGTDPQPDEKALLKVSTMKLPVGKEIVIFDEKGPGTIKQFNVQLKSNDAYTARNVVLRAYWDGSDKPAIWSPVGDFFGRAYGVKPYASLPLGMTDNGDYCLWRMPFKKAAKITLTNEGKQEGEATCSVRYSDAKVSDSAAYFYAKWRREAECETFDYQFLECTGKGKFIGDFLFVDNIVGGWWGEGDEKVYVDGEKFPSTFGTGSEDYFGDAWGIRWFVNPFHGCSQNEGRKQACYRFHITDSIPFTSQFKITIENYTAEGDAHNGYTSVAYWYAMPGGTDFFEPVAALGRMPSPKIVTPGATEVETLFDGQKLPESVKILDDAISRDKWSWGRAVQFDGSANASFALPFDIPANDNYTIELHSPEGVIPAEYQILYKDKPIGEKVWLTKGVQTINVKFPPDVKGTRTLVLDYAFLRPWRNFVRKWMLIAPFDNTDRKQLNTAYEPEKKIDFSAEYTGKDNIKAKWFEAEASPEGFVNIDAIMKQQKLPTQDVIAYAATYIESPSQHETELLVGSDDGVKIWLNGEVVHTNDIYRAANPDTDRVKIKLKKGKNTLLLKVTQGIGGWGFYLRIVDQKDELKYETK